MLKSLLVLLSREKDNVKVKRPKSLGTVLVHLKGDRVPRKGLIAKIEEETGIMFVSYETEFFGDVVMSAPACFANDDPRLTNLELN